MKMRPGLPALYEVLFELSSLREEAVALYPDGGTAYGDAVHFLSRVDAAEREALRLIEHVETRRRVAAH